MSLLSRTIFSLTITLAPILGTWAHSSSPLPSTDNVVSKILQHEEQRQTEFAGYTAIRHYVAVNKNRRAEMTVRVDCSNDSLIQLQVLSESGSGPIRQYVFRKLMSEEIDASRQGYREQSRITPQNYTFQLIREDVLDTGPAYVLTINPKSDNKLLMRGTIWVDARDFSIVRIEGQPARTPSFWLRSIQFVRTYRKVGDFWVTATIHSTEDIRLFGPAELWIETSNYALKLPESRPLNRFVTGVPVSADVRVPDGIEGRP
jgi:hypothetical protein